MDHSWGHLSKDWNLGLAGLEPWSSRLRPTWLQMVEYNLAALNIGLATACHQAQDWQMWSMLVGTSPSITQQATRWGWWQCNAPLFWLHVNGALQIFYDDDDDDESVFCSYITIVHVKLALLHACRNGFVSPSNHELLLLRALNALAGRLSASGNCSQVAFNNTIR